MGRFETVRERAVTVYLPTKEMVTEWKDNAARHDVSLSQFVHEITDSAISKGGSGYLRWMLTEAVLTHTRCEPDSRLSRFHAKVARRRGKQKAIVATARKLLLIIYWMLRTKEPYHSQGFNPGFPSARASAT